MTLPTPLLSESPLLSGDGEIIFPTVVGPPVDAFEFSAGAGKLRVESVQPFGCLRIVAVDGKTVGPVCHRALDCYTPVPAPTFPSRLAVYRLTRSGEYYAETESGCDSSCCDRLGMRFSADGRRLDDGLLQRIYMRLGLLGVSVLSVACVGLLFRVLGRPWLGWSVLSLLGFASATCMLWLAP